MPSYRKLIADLKGVLSELYLKHGSESEIITLSQILDEFIVEKQRSSLNLISIENRIKLLVESIGEFMFEIDVTNNKIIFLRNEIIDDMSFESDDIYNELINRIFKVYIHKDDYEKFKEKFSVSNILGYINTDIESITLESRMLIDNKYVAFNYTVEPCISDDERLIVLIYAKRCKETEKCKDRILEEVY